MDLLAEVRDASGAGFFFGPQSRPTKKPANLRAGHPAWTLQNCLAHPAQLVGRHGIRAQTGRRETQPQRRSRDGRRETGDGGGETAPQRPLLSSSSSPIHPNPAADALQSPDPAK
uniref:Uncharacterized protein n=1 Tax=Oryza nivara TaxID=4536 RepID=A0A0E0JBQ7_ORYNI